MNGRTLLVHGSVAGSLDDDPVAWKVPLVTVPTVASARGGEGLPGGQAPDSAPDSAPAMLGVAAHGTAWRTCMATMSRPFTRCLGI